MLAPPRIWENMLTTMQVKGGDASPAQAPCVRVFPRRGRALRAEARPTASRCRCGERLAAARRVLRLRPGARPARAAQRALVLHRRRAARARHLPLLPLLRRQPEAGLRRDRGVGAARRASPTPRPTPTRSAGRCRGIEVKIDDSGEVMLQGPNVFVGYYKQDEATRETLIDGRLAADRRCRLHRPARPPRRSSIAPRTSASSTDGTAFAPQFIENKLKFSPFIREAVAFGDGQPFVAAMIAIDMQTVGNWAEQQRLAYTSFMDLAASRRCAGLIPTRSPRPTPACPTCSRSGASCCSTRSSRPTTPR